MNSFFLENADRKQLADLDSSVFPFSWAEFELAISVFHPLNFQLAVPNYAISVFHPLNIQLAVTNCSVDQKQKSNFSWLLIVNASYKKNFCLPLIVDQN